AMSLPACPLRSDNTASRRGFALLPFWIRPLEGEAEPRSVALKGVVVDHDMNTRPVLLNLGDFRCICFARHRPVACFVVPDVVRPDALRHEIELALVPDALPSVEQVAQNVFVCHCTTLSYPCRVSGSRFSRKG